MIDEEDHVHAGQADETEDEWRCRTDHRGHPVDVQLPCAEDQQHHDDPADPGLQAPLLVQVGPGPGEHDEAGGKQGQAHADVEHPREHRAGDAVEDLAVLLGLEVGGQLQDDQRHRADYQGG